MAITALYTGSATISSTEYSLPSNAALPQTSKTDVGVLQLHVDLSTMIAGDQFELKIYRKVTSGGTLLLYLPKVYSDAQSAPGITLPSIIFRYGWEMTMKKLSATDRIIGWTIEQVA